MIVHNSYSLPRTKLQTTSKKAIPGMFGSNESLDIYVHPISTDFVGMA